MSWFFLLLACGSGLSSYQPADPVDASGDEDPDGPVDTDGPDDTDVIEDTDEPEDEPYDPTDSCLSEDLPLDWPFGGVPGEDWVINNYVDLNTGNDVLADYSGATDDDAKTYDNHRGIDIDVPNFRWMDDDFPVLAGADGEVVQVLDGNFDRNTSCSGSWNAVVLQHVNGFTTIYGHLKNGSPMVSVGDVVSAGDPIGVVGSSGCSSAAHLHFEVHDCDGEVVAPFEAGMWLQPPPYSAPLTLMDVQITEDGISGVDELKDPPADDLDAEWGDDFGIGLSLANGAIGDQVDITVVRGDGATHDVHSLLLTKVYRHHYWYWNDTFDHVGGTWSVEVEINGVLVATREIEVEGRPWIAEYGDTAFTYGIAAAQHESAGYRPVWIDVFEVDGYPWYNAIYAIDDGTPWVAWTDVDSATHQANFVSWLSAGYRPVHVDSVATASGVRYAAIFEMSSGNFAAYHGTSTSTHQDNFGDYTGQGYRPVAISTLYDGGWEITALYDTESVGSWVALYDLTESEYQAEFTTQANAGRVPAYIEATDVSGEPRISAIWDSRSRGAWSAQHDLSAADLDSALLGWESTTLVPRAIAGYDDGGVPEYAVFATEN